MKCEGICAIEGGCFGEVKTVVVSGLGLGKPVTFNYCQEAREEDERRGFSVEIVDENGLTDSDYYTGITYPNG
jgi:hypothetical protein